MTTAESLDPCVGVVVVQQLYHSWTGYAERLSEEQLLALHLQTPLEDQVAAALRLGSDVVLTGNPGDGKTHLLRYLQQSHSDLQAVEWIIDATAVEKDGSSPSAEATIYRQWLERRKAGVRTCLAINQGVLRAMLAQVERDEFATEIVRQLDYQLYYQDQPEAPKLGVVVIDLNRRSVLEPALVRSAIANLTDDRFYPECETCPARMACAVPVNRRFLKQDLVQKRVARILDMVGRSGFHATMRDLQGLIAYMITAGKTCPDLLRTGDLLGTRFYDLMFDGSGPLFDAVVSAFDPALVSSPLLDDALWTGTIETADWENASELQPPPNSYADDRQAANAMASAKRCHYFTQPDGADLEMYLPAADRAFYDLLESTDTRTRESTRKVVRLINSFFSRQAGDRELRLWLRHHFDVPPSRVYFASRSVLSQQLILTLPKRASWAPAAAADQPDHAMLIALGPIDVRSGARPAEVARLRVDREVYRGLSAAEGRQPFPLRRAELVNALETFLASIGAELLDDSQGEVLDVMVESFRSGQSYRFSVYPREGRYGS